MKLEPGMEIEIPFNCPKTKIEYGLQKDDKRHLLGTKAIIDRITYDKIVIQGGWYFHPDDFLTLSDSKEPPVEVPTQTFDPENLSL